MSHHDKIHHSRINCILPMYIKSIYYDITIGSAPISFSSTSSTYALLSLTTASNKLDLLISRIKSVFPGIFEPFEYDGKAFKRIRIFSDMI